MSENAQFSIGQLVDHKLFAYRGVIFDVDPEFMLSEQWYETVARSRPPKDQPWYHVLVDNNTHSTYVAERHLTCAEDLSQINHPMLGEFFQSFVDGHYVSHQRGN